MTTATDIFCGAGGTSIGAHMAGVEIVTAINHWELAIQSHASNFPHTRHDVADCGAVNPRRYPTTEILYASPECTNHSLARGRSDDKIQLDLYGLEASNPDAERSRATMGDVIAFTEVHRYRFIIVENVPDVRVWSGWNKWITGMTNLSYDYKVVYFNSMFCPPIPQSRDRVYITFWRQGSRKPDLDFMPAGWCKHCQTEIAARQTWKANHSLRIRYGKQYIYTCPRCHREVFPYTTPAAAAIDWTLPITRIGDRSKPLQPKTIARIKIGLARYHEFMLDCIHTPRGSDTSMIFPIDKPHRTQLGQITHGLVVQTSHGAGNRSQPLTKPLPTQTSAQDLGIVIGLSHANGNHVHLTTEPTATQTTRQDKALIMPPFLAKLYGQSTTEPIDAPIGTQTGGGIHHGLVIPYYNTGVASPTDKPLPTATGIARHGLVQPGSTIDVDDCYFRMLVSAEVGAAMNFPANYVVLGNERQRVKQYGQAVTPDVPAMITRRLLESIQ